MSEEELQVLDYVGLGMGGPDSIMASLKPVYWSLVKRGFIEPVVTYHLTEAGRRELLQTAPEVAAS